MKRLATLGSLVLLVTACATTQDVDKKIAEAQAKSDKKIESVEGQVEELQQRQSATEKTVDAHGKEIEQLSQSASEALKRAQEAGVLAKGKVVLQETFSEDRVRFRSDSVELSKDSRVALDEFADRIKKMDKGVWIEIQGHTDDRGGAERNDQLGQRRADEVRRYLGREHRLPLSRMSTISYGDTLPVESNKTAKGRAANRRVVIIVLE